MRILTGNPVTLNSHFRAILSDFRLPTLLLAGFIILAPSNDLLPVIGLYDEKRLLECALLLLIGLSLIINPDIRNQWTESIPLARGTSLLIFTTLALGAISAIFTKNQLHAFLDVSLYALLCVACLFIALERRRIDSAFDKFFSSVILLGGALYLLAFAAALAAATMEAIPLLHWDLFINFSHIRFFSQFQSWTLSLMILPVLMSGRERNGLKFWASLIICSGWWFLLFTSGTRGTMLGICIAAIVVTFAFGRHAFPWLKWQGITMLLGLLLYSAFFLLPSLLGSLDTSAVQNGTIGRSLTSPQGRFHLWDVALQMIIAHPFLGVGPMHYACGLTNGIAAHPHNSLIQIAAEWGLPAAVIVVFIGISGTLAWIRQGRNRLAMENACKTDLMIYPTLLAALVTAATHAMFSGVIIMPLSQVMMTLVIGWMLGIYYSTAGKQLNGRNPATAEIAATAPVWRFIWVLTTLLACIGLLIGIGPDLLDFGNLLNTGNIPSGARFFMPRFWQQGLICG